MLTDLQKSRIGEIGKNKYGTTAMIIDIVDAVNYKIEFQDEYHYVRNVRYDDFVKGAFINPYDPVVQGVGYRGVGQYSSTTHKSIHKRWCDMLKRAYNPADKDSAYINTTVCKEWHNFQNFAQWYEDNFYTIDGCVMQLDKDILCKGNREYCPDKCVFVPQFINAMFTKCNKARGNLPIGVTMHKGKYYVQCQTYLDHIQKQNYIGLFNSEKEAFIAYKKFKEDYLSKVAEEYKNKIPTQLYEALKTYNVDYDD